MVWKPSCNVKCTWDLMRLETFGASAVRLSVSKRQSLLIKRGGFGEFCGYGRLKISRVCFMLEWVHGHSGVWHLSFFTKQNISRGHQSFKSFNKAFEHKTNYLFAKNKQFQKTLFTKKVYIYIYYKKYKTNRNNRFLYQKEINQQLVTFMKTEMLVLNKGLSIHAQPKAPGAGKESEWRTLGVLRGRRQRLGDLIVRFVNGKAVRR